MDKKIIYDKLKKIVHSVQTKGQLTIALRYAERAAIATGNSYMTGAYLDFALRTHPTLLFEPFPPPVTEYLPGGFTRKYYNFDAEFLTGMLWQ